MTEFGTCKYCMGNGYAWAAGKYEGYSNCDKYLFYAVIQLQINYRVLQSDDFQHCSVLDRCFEFQSYKLLKKCKWIYFSIACQMLLIV